jgi:hypothetical protein
MPKTFEIKHYGDYISVKLGVDYEVSPEQEVEFWSAVEKSCKEHNCRSVLVEGYVPKRQPEPIEIVDSGVRASTVVPKLWFALCLENFEHSELSELFKVVARSRGVHVKFFTDRDQALKWLHSGSAE